MKNSLILFSLILISMCACSQKATQQNDEESVSEVINLEIPSKVVPIEKSNENWKAQLTENEYYILREKGTERAFSGDLWDSKAKCVYTCAGCELPLFDSNTKFVSGTGWPSFYKPLKSDFVKELKDASHGMVRTEVVCARCDGHLGHIFNDGPKPTGLRYCINSASLNYVSKQKP